MKMWLRPWTIKHSPTSLLPKRKLWKDWGDRDQKYLHSTQWPQSDVWTSDRSSGSSQMAFRNFLTRLTITHSSELNFLAFPSLGYFSLIVQMKWTPCALARYPFFDCQFMSRNGALEGKTTFYLILSLHSAQCWTQSKISKCLRIGWWINAGGFWRVVILPHKEYWATSEDLFGC